MRAANLARWPTGAAVDFDEAVAFHHAQPPHKQLAAAMRRAHAERRCLTQPRGGFGTLAMQKALMIALDRDGLADIVPTTTDSYTRNEQFAAAQKGIDESERLGRSLLNGFPIVNYGIAAGRELIGAIDKPAIMLTGTSMPKLTAEIGFASLQYDDAIGKLSLIGAGMKSHPGVSAQLFKALAGAGINIEMITTSDIRISVVTRAENLDDAVRAVHTAFDLDSSEDQAVVYGGTGR